MCVAYVEPLPPIIESHLSNNMNQLLPVRFEYHDLPNQHREEINRVIDDIYDYNTTVEI